MGTYEEAELSFISNFLKEGDVFVDVGANIGLHTLFASKLVGNEGKVISFEPFSLNFKSLKRNVSLNKSENIVLENLAISKDSETLDILYNVKDANLGMASSFLVDYSHKEKVDATTLDSYLSRKSYKK